MHLFSILYLIVSVSSILWSWHCCLVLRQCSLTVPDFPVFSDVQYGPWFAETFSLGFNETWFENMPPSEDLRLLLQHLEVLLHQDCSWKIPGVEMFLSHRISEFKPEIHVRASCTLHSSRTDLPFRGVAQSLIVSDSL